MQRLAAGPVICAEGYVFELERRGYLQAGAFVPEVLIEHPEVVEQLHRDFVHAGSDVVQALTYYVHREKLRVIGREKDLEPMNVTALAIARKVARETATLFAGDICNTQHLPARRTRAALQASGGANFRRSRSGWLPTPASTISSPRRSRGAARR